MKPRTEDCWWCERGCQARLYSSMTADTTRIRIKYWWTRERDLCETLYITDLTSHQLRQLSVVAVKHILQAQPERGEEVKHTIRHSGTEQQSRSTSPTVYILFLQTPFDVEQSLPLISFYKDGCRICDAELLNILLAGAEDTDWTQQLEQVAWAPVIFTLREGTEVEILIVLPGCSTLLCIVAQ